MSIVWDNHTCISLRSGKYEFIDELERHRQAGFTVVAVNIGYADTPWDQQLNLAHRLSNWLSNNGDKFFQIKSKKDLINKTGTDKLGVFFDVEGANLLDENLSRIPELYNLGVMWMCLTYNKGNAYVGGCLPGEIDNGLSELGRRAVSTMNDVGMMVCCSHTGKKSAMEIIDWSTKPVIFSHSNSNSVYQHWRNIDDDMAKACAEKGGVICVNGVGTFLGSETANVSTVMGHTLYLVDLLGSEHVGIGLDFVYDMDELEAALASNANMFSNNTSKQEAFTFVPPEALDSIRRCLQGKKFSEDEIDAVLGGNLSRVAKNVWA